MKTTPNFQDADAFYESLLDAHSGLSREASELLNARLILIMANQLGDSALLQACIAAASQTAPPSAPPEVSTGEGRPVE
jgi:hypothetical protein